MRLLTGNLNAIGDVVRVTTTLLRVMARWLMLAWLAAWAVFSLPWMSATSTPHWERVRPPYVRAHSRIRLDHIVNVLFYLPAVPLATAFGWPISASVGAAAAMSLAAEGAQVFSEDRAPNGNDVVANIAGAAAGALGVLLYRRRARQ